MLKNLRAKLSWRKVTPWMLWLGGLSIVVVAAAVGGLLVFWKGLVITNLTDLVPWGLWITIDLSSIAPAAGAFSLCAAVHLIGLKMSVLFMLSAMVGGIAPTLFASTPASRPTPRARVNDTLIEWVAGFLAWLLVGYFYFRFSDTVAVTYTYDPGRTEGLRLLTKGNLSFNFWIGEMLLGTFVPMVLLLYKKKRLNPFWRMTALFLVAASVVAFRWDTNLVGELAVMSYLPGKAAIAYGLLALSLGVKYCEW